MTIQEYLTAQKDVPFSSLPFHDVDNTILAELAYIDYEGIFREGEEALPLSEVERRFFATHDAEEIDKTAKFCDRAPLLLQEMAKGCRFRDILLSHYVTEVDTEETKQFSALVFHLSEKAWYIAYRGTDATLNGWKESLLMSYLEETGGSKAAVDYLNRIGSEHSGELLVGGHSKGGYFAMYASIFCQPEIQERITVVFNNDGPGMHEGIIFSPEYQCIRPRMRNIVPDSSLIGQLLFNEGEHKVVKSNAEGIFQHDAFSWVVEGTEFSQTKLSPFSLFMQASLGCWLEELDAESRASIIDTIFSLLETTGSESFPEMREQRLKNTETVLRGLVQLPEEKRHELLNAFHSLLGSGRRMVLKSLLP